MKKAALRKYANNTRLAICIVMVFYSRCGALPDNIVSVENGIESLVKDKNNFKVVSTIIRRNSTQIAFLKHVNGKRYVVKQRIVAQLNRHINVVRDVLGSRIALQGGILANLVAIIPRDYAFPGKYSKEFPATLHEVVPGIEVKSLPQEMKSFKQHIKQCLRDGQCKKFGLTREIIKNMAFHPDLCRIVALDTFIANKGRASDNFFYDSISDHYYAIDLASAFEYDAGQYACKLIGLMLKDDNCVLPKKELDGLIIYRNTLKRLLGKYSSDTIYEQMVDLAVEGGFVSRASVSKHMEGHKTMIKKNYDSCKKLVALLNTFISKHRVSVS